jgi:hypothetical protein
MRYNNPKSLYSNYIDNKLCLVNIDNNYNKVIAKQDIKKSELLIIEYPNINLFGEENIHRELKIIKKYIENKDTIFIKNLYPRSPHYKKTNMIKLIYSLIKDAKSNIKLYTFFQLFQKEELEFYFAKYIYNAFEGNNYGPLTLPFIAKLNHSCNPNVYFSFNKINCCMYVYSNKVIKKGEEITVSYLENKKIQNHKIYLEEHYGFSCNCN